MVIVSSAAALHPQMKPTDSTNLPTLSEHGPEDPAHIQLDRKLLKMMNVSRQKEMVRDAEKLLALATELKAGSDRDAQQLHTQAALRKAEQIEKLARSVQDKMRYPVGY